MRRPSPGNRRAAPEAREQIGSRRSPFHGRTAFHRDVAGFVLRELSYAPLTSLPRHSHETAYIAFVLEGRYREHGGRRKRHPQPDTIIFHPAGETHANQFG